MKLSIHIDPATLCSIDVIPLVSIEWKKLFRRVDMNKKYIAERGWSQLNRNLLLYKEIQDTMTAAERQSFVDFLSQIIYMSTVGVIKKSASISAYTNGAH